MIRIFFLALLLLLVISPGRVDAASPTHLWSLRGGGPSTDYGRAFATDAGGNIFVVGYFYGTANFGGANLVSAGMDDMFLVKYNAAGVHLWSKSFGSTTSDRLMGVGVDAGGYVYVGGFFSNTVNLGGANLTSSGGYDVCLAKFNPYGEHIWSNRYGGTSNDMARAVAVDPAGNVVIVGPFGGTASFGGLSLVTAGGDDIFVARYTTNGVHQWSQRYGGISTDAAYAVATDGNVFVTGNFRNTVNFGGGNVTSAGNEDFFALKLNSAGAFQWVNTAGGPGQFDTGWGIGVSASGDVGVTGGFLSTINFGGSTLVAVGGDAFLVKFNAAGVHQWSKRLGGSGYEEGNSVTFDAFGKVWTAGMFNNTLNLGGSDLLNGGSSQSYVARYDAAGNHEFSGAYGGDGADEIPSVVVDAAGHIVVLNSFQGSANFGGQDLVSAGSTDISVAKFASGPSEPIISAINDVANDQGRKVRIFFAASTADMSLAAAPIETYEVYRRNDQPPSLVATSTPMLTTGWSFVGSTPAHGEPDYSLDVPTVGDSTIALGLYRSVFFVRAATDNPFGFFDSPPDSGYSLDNLAPGVPSNLVFETGDLSWDESPAADFDYFAVYGSNTDSFGAAVVVDYSVAPAIDVSASPYLYYFVTATDFSGNEGKPAKVNTLSGVGGTPKSYVLSVSNYPNPFNPRTTVSYTVPSRGAVTVAVYDMRGAHVATLIHGENRGPGAYSIEWDGRAEDGASVSSGVYFARIEHASGVRSKKMVLLK